MILFESALVAFSSSCEGASVLVTVIYGELEFSMTAHLDHLARVRCDASSRHKEHIQDPIQGHRNWLGQSRHDLTRFCQFFNYNFLSIY